MANNDYFSGEVKMYDYINNVLSSYFSTSNELSEQEAVATLGAHLNQSPELKLRLHAELIEAFDDEKFSWMSELERNDVFIFKREEDALSYARKILWQPFFDGD